jgi:ribosomal protein L11 methyltransferase
MAKFEPEIRVRNLSYCEPEISNGSEKTLNPVDSILILPPGSDTETQDGKIKVIIDGRNAFGTGTHPSTILCLQELEALSGILTGGDNWLKGRNVLDFGCGSAILAIISIMLGAESALGVEINPESVLTARKNLKYNGLENRVDIIQGSWSDVEGEFDLIMANLVPSAILKSTQRIARHLRANGKVIISGFGIQQCRDIMEAFTSANFRIINKRSLREWCSLLLKKDDSSPH